MFRTLLMIFGLLLMLGLFIFGCESVTYVDSYEQGYLYSTTSGNITLIPRTGYIVHRPFLDEVHRIDVRPMQVCISANSRVLNCKLVQFDPAGLNLFLSWHGRGNYDNDPTASGSPSRLNQILMSYAYENTGKCGSPAKSYPFLKVLQESNITNGVSTP